MNEIILATNIIPIPPRHYTGISIQFIILIALLFIIVWLLKDPKKTPYTIHEGDSALDILNKRYASGELTKEQYESIKKDIALKETISDDKKSQSVTPKNKKSQKDSGEI